jgi:hypothetical protein
MLIIDGYRIDAELSGDHTTENEVTEHPVEEGSDIVDHVRARPFELTVEGIVSDTPFGELREQRLREAGRLDLLDLAGDVERIEHGSRAYDKLRFIFERRQPVTIQTSAGIFERMAPLRLSRPTSAREGDACRFAATFRQVRLVANERTLVRTPPIAAKRVNLGHKPVFQVDDFDNSAAEIKRNIDRIQDHQSAPVGRRTRVFGGQDSPAGGHFSEF